MIAIGNVSSLHQAVQKSIMFKTPVERFANETDAQNGKDTFRQIIDK